MNRVTLGFWGDGGSFSLDDGGNRSQEHGVVSLGCHVPIGESAVRCKLLKRAGKITDLCGSPTLLAGFEEAKGVVGKSKIPSCIKQSDQVGRSSQQGGR